MVAEWIPQTEDMYEEEPTDLVDDIIRPDPKLGDVVEQCAIHQVHIKGCNQYIPPPG